MAAYQCCFAKVYDRLMKRDTEKFASYILDLLSTFAVDPPARVLDIGCGTGHIAIELAKNGYRVRGGDISPAMLEEAVKKAHDNNVHVAFSQMDMTKMELDREVVAVVSVCDPVNYLSPIQAPLFFSSAYEQLPHNGLLLFDVSTPYYYQQEVGNDLYGEVLEDAAYLLQTEVDDQTCMMEMTMFAQRRNGLYERSAERHMLYQHAKETLERVLYNVGFDGVWIYEFGTQNPPEEHCPRWQFVAKKN